MKDLITLGEIMLRLSPPANERIEESTVFTKHVGGAELNVAAGCAMLGLKTGVISALPDNSVGEYARRQIRALGVDDSAIFRDRGKASRIGVYYYENGAYPRKPGIAYDRLGSSFSQVDPFSCPPGLYKSTRCFHTSGITLALSPEIRKAAVRMIRRFRKEGAIISFDVNFRGNLWTGQQAREAIEDILPYVDVFFCSEDTARLTFDKKGSVEDMMRSFAEDYPIKLIAAAQRIVHSPTRHSFSSVIYDTKEDCFYSEPAYENIEVVDRIGSGDAFVAGTLSGYLTSGSCKKALEYGNAASSLQNTIQGDLPGYSALDVRQVIEDHQSSGRVAEMDR